jgi:hypothetical protein
MTATDATLVDPPSPTSVSDLTVTRERSRTDVNRFLERHHPRGGVSFWYACFGARYQDHLVSCVVIERPSSRLLDDGTVAEITRFGIREDRPANTGSWLIARVRRWAALEGFDRLITYAGVAGNEGTTYRAAGFECTDVSQAEGDGWARHGDGRDTWADYERRRFEYDLDGVEVRE